ncbi:MAG: putative xanthine dehydrogenase subunit [Chloroflexi bacterium]|nr:putative xanthine dehydrogenase subunit [Chloroflexota bacterium]
MSRGMSISGDAAQSSDPALLTQQRLDCEMKVTGRIPYALNVELPGMAWARCVRSPYAHARIVSVDASRALALPGVVAVLTRDDLVPGARVGGRPPLVLPYYGAAIKDQPIVAIEKVRHVGDIVAAVVADDADIAAAAAELVDVEYEELPAVFDAVEALRADAPLVHEQIIGRYEIPPSSLAIIEPVNGTNLINHMKVRHGDVEVGFREADLVFEDRYSSPALHHCALEPHVTVADWGGDSVTIYTATQMPHFVRQQVAEIFGMPTTRVRVLVYTLGGGYGSKTYARMEPLAAVLAWKTGRPVKLVLTRPEEFVTTTKHEAHVRIKSGVKRDGTLVAREVEVYYNAGAYADRSGTIARSGGIGAAGPYRIPNVKVDAYAVYTNRPNAAPFRGLAVSQVAWAYERHTDELARQLSIDPIEFRRRNLLSDGDRFCTGEGLSDIHFRQLLDEAAEAVGYDEPLPPPSAPEKMVGRGAAVIIKHMGSNPATTTLAICLHADGAVEALSSTVDLGQGSRTVVAREVARALSVAEAAVRVPFVDTEATPPDQGTSSSRSSFFNAMAARAAADDLRRQIDELRSELNMPGDANPWSLASAVDLLRKAKIESITGVGEFHTEIGVDRDTGQGKASHHWHQAAAAAIVEVDRETGKVTPLRLHVTVHAGRVIDRANAELQNEGCAAFGLSQALFEEMRFDGGQVINANLSDYNVASLRDFPVRFTTSLSENLVADAEVHGLGETALPSVPPALGNAVRDATGVSIAVVPMTPDRVLETLRMGEQ